MRAPSQHSLLTLAGLALGASLAGACDGPAGEAGPAGQTPGDEVPHTPTELERGETAPAVIVQILGPRGGSGDGGRFRSGDRITIDFRLEKPDGSPWSLKEMTSGRCLVSGPTFQYQRVLPEVDDVIARAQELTRGLYSYTLPEPLPAVFLPPYNDSRSFGLEHGELAGEPLLDGTYTLGLSFGWSYSIRGTAYLEVGEATLDFLLGDPAEPLTPRALSSRENCNVCHLDLQAHRGRYRELTMCLLCHTAGAEDGNDPALAGGTPGVTIDSSVLFHRIHNGRHLPSVNGIGLHPDGTLDYSNPPRPFLVVGQEGALRDYSSLASPIEPGRTLPMPRDYGYSSLSPKESKQDDRVRAGLTACVLCHGDPDGSGPLAAPAQGSSSYVAARYACQSCHDDVDFGRAYVVNTGLMEPQADDGSCIKCHGRPFIPYLEARLSHIHPLQDPNFSGGLRIELLAVQEAGQNDGDGRLDPGEKVAITFNLLDDQGLALEPESLGSLRALVSGPSWNMHLIAGSELPLELLAGPQPFTVTLTEPRLLEFVGDSSPGLEFFGTGSTPLVDPDSIRVWVRTDTFTDATTVSRAASRHQVFVDVADSSGLARDDVIVLDDGVIGAEEYLRLQQVEGQRLWFQREFPAGLKFNHLAGASVRRVELTPKLAEVDYRAQLQSGRLEELTEFGPGNAVIMSYTTEFVLPAEYPGPLNGSPDLGEAQGVWTGKALLDGTYRIALTGTIEQILNNVISFEEETYPITSAPAVLDFLVGSALDLEPYDLISSGESCNACHQDLHYHSGLYRGFDTCLPCHGAAGTEDLPRDVAPNAPATPGLSVNFRSLLHKIHSGRELSNRAFQVVGAGTRPYPDNFEAKSYAEVVFPAQPGAAIECRQCHGPDNEAWLLPADRTHSIDPLTPALVWRPVCNSCHDGTAVTAHMEAETSPSGFEGCVVCHGPGEELGVDRTHLRRRTSAPGF